MLILLMETSSEFGVIALSQKDRVLTSRTLAGGRDLSKSLALEVQTLLDGRRPDLIAVGRGPGSYTGIRVGASLAKGLAMGFQARLLGFNSLEAYGPAPVLIDAKRGGFYALLEEEALLLSPEDPRLQNLGLIGSPHPELIQKRLASGQFAKREPCPHRLAELVFGLSQKEEASPFTLNYISCPC